MHARLELFNLCVWLRLAETEVMMKYLIPVSLLEKS